MRSLILSLAVFGCTSALGIAAEQAVSDNPRLHDLAWVIGEWQGEYVLPEGVPEMGPAGSKVVHFESWRWSLEKKFITLRIRAEIDGKVISTGQEIVGFDDATGRLLHWIFTSAGDHGSGIWSRENDVWMLKWQGMGSDGRKFQGTSDQIRIDADTYTWQMRDIIEDGKKMPDWPKVTLRRRKGAAADDLWAAYRDAAAGTWEGTGELHRDLKELGIAKGDKFRVEYSSTSEAEGKALVGEMDFQMVDDAFTAKARVLAGWDPDQRQIRFFTYWSGGVVEEITLFRRVGNTFFGTYVARSPGSDTLRSRIRIKYTDPDSYTITFVSGPHKGKLLASWTRKN